MSVYACSDLHGRYDLWAMIKKDLKEDDILYFLGDACDRGPDGWKIIRELLEDKRVIYIQGNHEDMLYHRFHGFDMDDLWIHNHNGGQVTADAAILDSDYMEITSQLHKLPYSALYINKDGKTIFMTHSGCLPSHQAYNNDYLLWDRRHYYHPQNEYDLVIHGHTPVDYLIEDLSFISSSIDTVEGSWDGGAFFYQDNTKCCIDMGAFFTNRTVLLDLDTFESRVYVGEELR